MIVSHRHRFVFFPVPKTATQSVRAALRPHLGPDDWEQADWRTTRRAPIPELAAHGHGHLSIAQVRPHLDTAVWRDYLKFTFVRDPWDRFASAAWYENGGRPFFRSRPVACMKVLLETPETMERLHFRPQHAFVTEEADDRPLDFVGRFETLERDFTEVCRRMGLDSPTLPRLNVSRRAGDGVDFDDELREKVATHYERDIRIFGYGRA